MMIPVSRRFALLIPLVTLSATTMASAQSAADVEVTAAWVREATTTQPSTGAFLVIANRGTSPLHLVRAGIAGAKAVELHKSEIQNEKMMMRKVDRITIPPGGTVELKPGSFHIMLIGLEKAFPVGGKVPVTLEFEGGLKKTIEAEVRPRMMPSE